MKTLCQECGLPVSGREDKRFCSSHCRSAYHNRKNGPANNLVRRVNSVLRKNRNILSSLNGGPEKRISRDTLLYNGFNFAYFTHLYRGPGGKKYYFCYDQGYCEVGKGEYLLMERSELPGEPVSVRAFG